MNAKEAYVMGKLIAALEFVAKHNSVGYVYNSSQQQAASLLINEAKDLFNRSENTDSNL